MTSEPDEQALEAEAARVIAKYDLQPEDVNDEARRAAWKAAHPSDLGPMATEGRKQEFAEAEQAALRQHAERVAESLRYDEAIDGPRTAGQRRSAQMRDDEWQSVGSQGDAEALRQHAEQVAESWGYVVGEDGAVEPVGEPAFVPLSDRFDGSRNEATSRPVPQTQREVFTPINRAARRKAERDARRGR